MTIMMDNHPDTNGNGSVTGKRMDLQRLDYLAGIGARLRDVRLSKGLSLEEAAVALDVSASVIGSWERGDRAISAWRLLVVADAYGVPASALLPSEHDQDSAAELVRLRNVVDEVRTLTAMARGGIFRHDS